MPIRTVRPGREVHVEREPCEDLFMSRSSDFRASYGPWALVTGASSGIGEQFARQLARRGLNVLLVARRRERLDALAGELSRRRGPQAEVIAVDLGEASGVDQVLTA